MHTCIDAHRYKHLINKINKKRKAAFPTILSKSLSHPPSPWIRKKLIFCLFAYVKMLKHPIIYSMLFLSKSSKLIPIIYSYSYF